MYDGTVVTVETDAVSLPDLTETFFYFLAGCTFSLPASAAAMAEEAVNARDRED
jgi:hypothetical protein